MAGRRAWTEDDPGGGVFHIDPGDAGRYAQTFGSMEYGWLIISDVEKKEDLKKLHPKVSCRAIQKTFPQYIEVNKMKSGSFLIKVNKSDQEKTAAVNILKDVESRGQIINIPIQVKVHQNMTYSKGSVYNEDIPLYTKEELLEELKGQKVVDVEKLTYRDQEGTIRDSNKCILTFNTVTLPSHINLYFARMTVKQHIPNPMLCKNCWAYGHTKNRCSSPAMCANCGKTEHLQRNASGELIGKCDYPSSCLNCSGGKHSSWNRQCPTYQKEQAIVKIMTIQRVSYNHAAFLYNQQRETKNIRSVRAEEVTKTDQSDRLCRKMTEMTQMIKLLCGAVFALVKGKQPELTQLQDMLEMNETNKKTVKRTRVEEEEDIEEVVEEDMDIGQGGNTTYSARVASQLGNWGPFASSSKEGRTGYYTSSAVGPAVRLKDPG